MSQTGKTNKQATYMYAMSGVIRYTRSRLIAPPPPPPKPGGQPTRIPPCAPPFRMIVTSRVPSDASELSAVTRKQGASTLFIRAQQACPDGRHVCRFALTQNFALLASKHPRYPSPCHANRPETHQSVDRSLDRSKAGRILPRMEKYCCVAPTRRKPEQPQLPTTHQRRPPPHVARSQFVSGGGRQHQHG